MVAPAHEKSFLNYYCNYSHKALRNFKLRYFIYYSSIFYTDLQPNFFDRSTLPGYDSNEPSFKILATETSCCFSYNERGFRAKDVLSLCSLAVSTKTKGDFLGHKGAVLGTWGVVKLIFRIWKKHHGGVQCFFS